MLPEEVAGVGGSVGFLMIPALLWAYVTGFSAGNATEGTDAATLMCKSIHGPWGFRR